MDFNLTFNMDNAAFDGAARGAELVRILRKVAAQIEADPDHDGATVADLNGNKIGDWWIEGERPADAETIVAFHVSDPGGHYIERHEVRDGEVYGAYLDCQRSADALREEATEEREEAGEDYPDDPSYVSFCPVAEFANGDCSTEFNPNG